MATSALTTYRAPGAADAAGDSAPSDSARGAVVAGIAILLAFFGGFGAWAVTAPLNSAVVGNAVVKVEGNRKSVQHLEGGIVRALRVHEGDVVKAGDVLVALDDSALRSQVDTLTQQKTMFLATEARLVAEQNGSSDIAFPEQLTSQRGLAHVDAAMAGQLKEFGSRKVALAGEETILRQRANQLREQIAGARVRLASQRAQLKSVIDEKESLADLVQKQLVTRGRMLQLERTAAGLQGDIGSTEAEIAKSEQAVGELLEQIGQIRKAQLEKIAAELREIRQRIVEVGPKLDGVASALDRLDIKAPYSGKVVGLSAFSIGGVIRPGERILDIVPEGTDLVVEAQVGVEDISEIRPGMAAEVHFTSYKQRVVPLIRGMVDEVSADRLVDEKTGAPFYLVQVSVRPEDLAANPHIRLYPGMPATVMVPTEERTALDYLVGPLVASFDRSFRQR